MEPKGVSISEGDSDSGAAPWPDGTAGQEGCDVARRDPAEHISTIGFRAHDVTSVAMALPVSFPPAAPPSQARDWRGTARRPGPNRRSTATIRHYPHHLADPRPRSGLAYFGDPRILGG